MSFGIRFSSWSGNSGSSAGEEARIHGINLCWKADYGEVERSSTRIDAILNCSSKRNGSICLCLFQKALEANQTVAWQSKPNCSPSDDLLIVNNIIHFCDVFQFTVSPSWYERCFAALNNNFSSLQWAIVKNITTFLPHIFSCSKSNLKKVSLELGGKSPLIICSDCDLEKAIRFVSDISRS